MARNRLLRSSPKRIGIYACGEQQISNTSLIAKKYAAYFPEATYQQSSRENDELS